MPDFLYDLPLAVVGSITLAGLWLFAMAGLLLVRRHLVPRLHVTVDDSEFSGAILQSVMCFYGLAVALIAVNVFQSYSDTSKLVSNEATSIAALYRDVSCYPEAIRPRLQDDLRGYVRYVIDQAWPLQQRGKVPDGGVELLDRFQTKLVGFEPASEGQKLMHGETLGAYNRMVLARRLRLDAVGGGIPGIMWSVILIGAVISLSSSFFFKVEAANFHSIQVLLLATFVGLVIFMIFALDHPYRGDLGIGSGAYPLIYDHLMKP